MDYFVKYIGAIMWGVIIGIFVSLWINRKHAYEGVEIKETVKIDTVYLEEKEYVFVEVPKPVYLRDTVINQIIYPVNKYKGLEPVLYGDIFWTAETSGFLNKMDFETNFKIPQISTIIEREITRTLKPSGLYGVVVIGVNPGIGASLLKGDNMFGYRYRIDGAHEFVYGRRIARF